MNFRGKSMFIGKSQKKYLHNNLKYQTNWHNDKKDFNKLIDKIIKMAYYVE